MLDQRWFSFVLLLVSGGVLLGVVYAEVVLKIAPCILCLVQRGPWVVVALLAAVAFQPSLPVVWRKRLLLGCGLAFALNAGVAAYHGGVEYQWWSGTAACGAAPQVAPSSLADLKVALAQATPEEPRCDVPGWTLGGISFAGYNFMLCLMLLGATAWQLRRWRD